VTEGSFDRERELHRRFSHLRIGHAEQFEPGDDLVGFIVAEASPWDGADEATELKAVRLELTAEIHKELRVEAAKQDMSMTALVRGLVEEYLAKRAKKEGGAR
jgi:hypothetical protein